MIRRRVLGVAAVAVMLMLAAAVVGHQAETAGAHGETFPPDFNEQEYVRGLAKPTSMTFAPDGRLFISEKNGQIRVVKNDQLLPDPFATLAVDSFRERGLLGLAFDPDYPTNNFLYVFYTSPTPTCHNQISRLTANGDVAAPGSEIVIFDLGPCGSGGHNGGSIHFGLDEKLYAAIGDQNIAANAQDTSNLFGKIVRINTDGSIPDDNPFYGTLSGDNRAIWAFGMRNPFTFAVQPGTGLTLVNDVGEHMWEEVTDATAGANLGWPLCEGYCVPPDPTLTDPVFAYAHGDTDTTGCAITGGAFYNPVVVQFPSTYVGMYFFTDYCAGWIRYLDPADGYSVHDFMQGSEVPVDIDIGLDGRLYYLIRVGSTAGSFVQVIEQSSLPGISKHPTERAVVDGQPVTFNALITGNGPFTYQWQRAQVDIPGATSQQLTFTPTLADDGSLYRIIVSNAAGTVVSNEAPLTVTVNQPPTVDLTLPMEGALYQGGSVVEFSASTDDAEDGTLDGSALTWEVVFHHHVHTHPFLEPFSGVMSGNFTIPVDDHTDSDVWYRVHVTAEDSNGATTSTYRDVLPDLRTLTFETSPPGLDITIDDIPIMTQHVEQGVVGVERRLGPVEPQIQGGATWELDSWSDLGASTHTIATPAEDTTYTAVYRVSDGLVGSGDGLRGEYYDNDDLTGLVAIRDDQTLSFGWADEPIAGVDADTFSVRWTGEIEGQFTEQYSLTVTADDGVRMWLDDVLVIDEWNSTAASDHSVAVALVGAERHSLRVEHREGVESAELRLRWSSPSTPLSIVPMSQLHLPDTEPPDLPPAVVVDFPAHRATEPGPVTFTGTASDYLGVVAVDLIIRQAGTQMYWDGVDEEFQPGWHKVAATLDIPGGASVGWTYTFDPPTTVVVRVATRATDTGGNKTFLDQRNTVSVGPPPAPPLVELLTPQHKAIVALPVSVTGNASDDSAIDNLFLVIKRIGAPDWWDGTAWVPGWRQFEIAYDEQSETFSYSFDPGGAGAARILARAKDDAGQVTLSANNRVDYN